MKVINIFAEVPLDAVFESGRVAIVGAIESQSEDYLLNVNEEEYVQQLVNQHTIIPLTFDREALTTTPFEAEIPAERHSREYDVRPGRSYTRQVIKFHLPYMGSRLLLRCVPSSRMLWSHSVEADETTISFDIINWDNNPEVTRNQAFDIITKIEQQAKNVNAEVAQFNILLKQFTLDKLRGQKAKYARNNEFTAKLGIPLRKRKDTSATFSVPSPEVRRPIGISSPSISGVKPRPLEPTLDESTYRSILKIIYDVGCQFERMPSTYRDKSEEDIRDHFLLFLEPNFEGSATGETFNKSGKTDILLRHEGKNIFIAECKFWRGKSSFLSTIDQLLGYLTWRDSKAAIILFVENKEFSSVLTTIKETTPNHPNYLREVGNTEETWFNLILHLEGDREREVKLAILVFHFPK